MTMHSGSQVELARLAALERYRVLDTGSEREFDDIVSIAAELCGVPIALISLIDEKRQWFKAAFGVEVAETPREIAFCDHAIRQRDVLVVEDTTQDARFAQNPLVTGAPYVRFYAGAPLLTADGLAIGTLCVLDRRPRGLNQTHHLALEALARQVMTQLELRKALAEQRAQEVLNRLILDSALDYAIISLDLTGVVTSWNEGARRILGWTAAEMAGRRCDDFFTEEDRAARIPEREMDAALRHGRGSDERWHLRKDGSRFFASGEMMTLNDESGRPLGFLKIVRDRTRRRMVERTQQALLELGDRLATLLDLEDMAFAAAQIVGGALDAGAARYATVTDDGGALQPGRGWSADGAVPVPAPCLPEPPARDAYLAKLAEGRTVVIADTANDPRGAVTFLATQGAGALLCEPLLERGRLVALLCVIAAVPREWERAEIDFVREVAGRTRLAIERRRAEYHYRELNASLEAQVEARVRERNRLWTRTGELLATAGLDGYLKEINPAWSRLLGWDDAELLSRPFLDFINTGDRTPAAGGIQRPTVGEGVPEFIDSLYAKDGSCRTVAWSTVPEGDLLYIVGRDITAQRDMEDKLRQSQKMEAIGQLTGGIAHDFNNLLAGILGSVDLIRIRLKAGRYETIERFVDAASRSAKSAASLTERLLAFSRRQSLDARPHDINKLIAGMEDLLHRTLGENIELHTALHEGLWPAIADANQLENVLLNLVINARDAMPTGGRLTLHTDNAQLDDTGVSIDAEVEAGDYVAIGVSDTGCGMSPEVMARAFDPFFTTKPIGQGTGLGLSMIYGFAKQSGGHVRLVSKVGEGTTFTLYLPRAQSRDATQVPFETRAVPRGDGETVLIVEDDATVRMLVVEVLKELGYAYLEAPDPQAALKMLATDIDIDLLLTDVGLPGMNGRQLAEIARQTRSQLKVLFLTGYAENAVVRGGFLGPGMDMISKPFALDALATKVRDMVTRSASPPGESA